MRSGGSQDFWARGGATVSVPLRMRLAPAERERLWKGLERFVNCEDDLRNFQSLGRAFPSFWPVRIYYYLPDSKNQMIVRHSRSPSPLRGTRFVTSFFCATATLFEPFGMVPKDRKNGRGQGFCWGSPIGTGRLGKRRRAGQLGIGATLSRASWAPLGCKSSRSSRRPTPYSSPPRMFWGHRRVLPRSKRPRH